MTPPRVFKFAVVMVALPTILPDATKLPPCRVFKVRGEPKATENFVPTTTWYLRTSKYWELSAANAAVTFAVSAANAASVGANTVYWFEAFSDVSLSRDPSWDLTSIYD